MGKEIIVREALQFAMGRAECVVFCLVFPLKWIPKLKASTENKIFCFKRNETRGIDGLNFLRFLT